jgi:anti-sigma-K factor RskA
MTHDDVRDLSTEYLLGTLDASLRDEVARHLSGCAECRAELAEDAKVLDALGRGAPAATPPPALRDRVLRAAADRAPVRVPRAVRSAYLPWVMAAAAALVAALAGWQVIALRTERQRLEQVSAEQQRSLAVLAAADLVRFDLRGAGSAHARAFWSHRHGLVFSAEQLAPAAPGKTYQLWVISGGTPISAGVFSPGADGQARIVMATPATLTKVDAVAVTVEPEGGLAAPSAAPILAGTPN